MRCRMDRHRMLNTSPGSCASHVEQRSRLTRRSDDLADRRIHRLTIAGARGAESDGEFSKVSRHVAISLMLAGRVWPAREEAIQGGRGEVGGVRPGR